MNYEEYRILTAGLFVTIRLNNCHFLEHSTFTMNATSFEWSDSLSCFWLAFDITEYVRLIFTSLLVGSNGTEKKYSHISNVNAAKYVMKRSHKSNLGIDSLGTNSVASKDN